MRRLPTMIASASAAALTALAVTIAVPAIADDGPAAKGEDEFASCLRANGLDGAPDGAGLKPWLRPRIERNDATTRRALEECSPKPGIVKVGPSEQELRSCLKDHGVEVPGGDARALKRWLFQHHDDAAYRDALKACDMAVVTKPPAGPCDKDGGAGAPAPAGRPDKVEPAEPGGTEVRLVSAAG